ncbi:MAG TPA: tRNA dihydrouridine synthase DusB [Anaerolineae bacterium]|nr:tRNA dihydrouridine synthase DusB [Anaerolineae bacterium]HMR66164.1 tRNA dihydrouridine synthase DusB [Anaerolineae bacterium]
MPVAPGCPTFWVSNIPVHGDVILSPMAGFSDKPYRLICREYGSAMSYTEFVSVQAINNGNERTWQMLAFDPSERPMTFQIFGADETAIEAAARRIEQLGPDIIDINMGCSVPKVSGKGAGAALLRDPAKIGRIFKRLSQALSVPVTGKIRLGWDEDSLNYLEVAKVLEDNGASLIAVHGRTKAQAYTGTANWDAIAQIKQAVRIPVIGNGDVACVADIERMKRQTGCDAVMIARAAIGNPWIFQGKDLDQVSLAEKASLIYRHLQLMLDFYGRERGLVLFRKHVVKYVRGLAHSAEVKTRLITCTQPEEFIALMNEYETGMHARQARRQSVWAGVPV